MIPEELKKLNRWVCCSEGSKIPMKAWVNETASVSDHYSWSDYETAATAVKNHEYDYIGYVFHKNDGYVGIDIDGGVSDNGLTPDAYDIVSRCKSYCEISKSGRGLHIILKATLPFYGRNNRRGIEIYNHNRFFILTGRVTSYRDIISNQEAVDYVVNTYFKESVSEKKHSLFKEPIYKPVWKNENRHNGLIKLRPYYPPIPKGCRNISLLSIGGSLLTAGYSERQIYRELSHVNKNVCTPPLQEKEVKLILKSVMKYDNH